MGGPTKWPDTIKCLCACAYFVSLVVSNKSRIIRVVVVRSNHEGIKENFPPVSSNTRPLNTMKQLVSLQWIGKKKKKKKKRNNNALTQIPFRCFRLLMISRIEKKTKT